MASFSCLYCWLWTYLTPYSSVTIVNFEHVIGGWERTCQFSTFQCCLLPNLLKDCFALQSCDRFLLVLQDSNAQKLLKQKLYNWTMEKKQKIFMKRGIVRGNCPRGNYPRWEHSGGSCPGDKCPRWELSGKAIVQGGIVLEPSFVSSSLKEELQSW